MTSPNGFDTKWFSQTKTAEIFKQPKNREDSSDFDDFRTKRHLFLEKFSKERN